MATWHERPMLSCWSATGTGSASGAMAVPVAVGHPTSMPVQFMSNPDTRGNAAAEL